MMRRKLEQHNSKNGPRGHGRHLHDMLRTSILNIHFHRSFVMFQEASPQQQPLPLCRSSSVWRSADTLVFTFSFAYIYEGSPCALIPGMLLCKAHQ
eukprot:1137991-Pelagomonas_calceolata.AAC.1